MNPNIYILLGIVPGVIIGWLLRMLWPQKPDSRIENELRDQLRARELELKNERERAIELEKAGASVSASQRAVQVNLDGEREATKQLKMELAVLQTKLASSERESVTAKAELEARNLSYSELDNRNKLTISEARQLNEQVAALKKHNGELEARAQFLDERLSVERLQIETIQKKFHQDFEAISDKLLTHSSTRFTEQSAESLKILLTPLKQTMDDFKANLDVTRKETVANSALLKDQISRISTEASNLSKALKGDAKALGNWGENMLDQILEKSGLQEGIHYHRQHGAKDSEGDRRFLDVVIELPEQRNLIVDSKVSLRSYEESINCTDETLRKVMLDKHVEAVRKHINDLGRKRYQDIGGVNGPDFVLMYIPIEAAFFAAIGQESNLFAEALEQNVVLITNSTLLATLRTVAHVWRLADQQKHALEIADRGGKLYDKFVGFISDLDDVGNHLKKGLDVWEQASNKLHTGSGNLVRQAEQLKELGSKATKKLSTELLLKASETNDLEIAPASVPTLPTPGNGVNG